MKTKTLLKQLLTTPVCGLIAGILALGILGGSVSAQTPALLEDLKLTASDAAAADVFGIVSLSGDVAIVGALLDDDRGIDSGSAYIYRFDPDTSGWIEEAKLLASDGIAGANFGLSVVVSGDVAVVGAPRDNRTPPSFAGKGAAYVYRYNGASWVETKKLVPSDGPLGGMRFGTSVAISGDVVIVGAPANIFDDMRAGAAYVYRYDGVNWVETKLTASDAAHEDQFGETVAVIGDVAFVGSFLDDDKGDRSGSVYVYRYNGAMWIEEAKLLASDGAVDQQFGRAISMSGDVAVVSARGDDSFIGAAYVYRLTGSTWVEESKLAASDGATGDSFGTSVSVSGDVVTVGANGDDDQGSFSGSAYVYRYDGSIWVQETKLLPSDGGTRDAFGQFVSTRGNIVMVGALQDDDHGTNSGAVYTYDLLRDLDGDGLTDVSEINIHGTDPLNTDTDGDGLTDFTEVDTAVSGCPDPLNPDSDGDTLLDGTEVAIGTDPCNPDSDGDGLPDNLDPLPLDPEITPGVLEDATRSLCAVIQTLDLSLFNGPNDNANAGRRNALANRACSAANAIADDDIDGAIDELASLLTKIDGDSPPPDWMHASNVKTALASDVSVLIALLLLEL